MKKLFFSLFITLSLFATVSYAKNGDITGNVYSTDIRTFINGIEVESVNIGGKTAIVTEKTVKPLFLSYNDNTRTLSLGHSSFAKNSIISGKNESTKNPGTIIGNIYETDIKTIMYDNEIPSFNIGGYTAFAIEDFAGNNEFSKFGAKFIWNEKERTLHTEVLYNQNVSDILKDNKVSITVTSNEDMTDGFATFKELYGCCQPNYYFDFPNWASDPYNNEVKTAILPIKAKINGSDELIGHYFICPSQQYKFTAFTTYNEDLLDLACKTYSPMHTDIESVINHYSVNHAGMVTERFDTQDYSFVIMSAKPPRGIIYYVLKINKDGSHINFMSEHIKKNNPDISYNQSLSDVKFDKENETVTFIFDKEYKIDLNTDTIQ